MLFEQQHGLGHPDTILHLMQGSGSLHTCGRMRISSAAWANLSVASVSFASSLSGLTCPMSAKPPPPSTELCNHRQMMSTLASLTSLDCRLKQAQAEQTCEPLLGSFKQPRLAC